MKYRSDIDGLRGIAILSVVIFHIFPSWMKGGFIGVDVFFVISGYLISTIIFSNLDKGNFSFTDFYSRRIKRIFPALILVLATCILFGWFTLLAEELQQLGKHIASGSSFISNFVLRSESGYFDSSAEVKPLLHLWSLSIEEQFYLVWPLLIWLAWKQRYNLLIITILAITVSFILNVNGATKNPIRTFYLPQTRFWELLVGSALAWVSLYKRVAVGKIKNKINNQLNSIICIKKLGNADDTLPNMLSIIGIAILSFGFWRINKDLIFPGWWALLPVFGTVLIIFAGPKCWVNQKILSNKIIVWLGLISFPLYLWHWPILSFSKILSTSSNSIFGGMLILISSVLLSWATYYFVESKLRNRSGSSKVITKVLLLGVLVCLIAGIFINLQGGFPQRYKATFKLPEIYSAKCEPVSEVQDSWCWATSNPLTAIIGDSHAHQLFAPMALSSHPSFSKLLSLGAGNCPPIEGVSDRCNLQIKHALPRVLSSASIKHVFIGAWNIPLREPQESLNGFRKLISSLEKGGKKVVFVIDMPTLTFDPLKCKKNPIYIRELARNFFNQATYCETIESQYFKDTATYDEMVQKLKDEFPKVYFYDPKKLFCQSNSCKLNINDEIIYSDSDHLSDFGRKIVVDSMMKELTTLNF